VCVCVCVCLHVRIYGTLCICVFTILISIVCKKAIPDTLNNCINIYVYRIITTYTVTVLIHILNTGMTLQSLHTDCIVTSRSLV
jgi:hypothetical protein